MKKFSPVGKQNKFIDIDLWDMSTLILVFKEHYLDCFGKSVNLLFFFIDADFKANIVPHG